MIINNFKYVASVGLITTEATLILASFLVRRKMCLEILTGEQL